MIHFFYYCLPLSGSGTTTIYSGELKNPHIVYSSEIRRHKKNVSNQAFSYDLFIRIAFKITLKVNLNSLLSTVARNENKLGFIFRVCRRSMETNVTVFRIHGQRCGALKETGRKIKINLAKVHETNMEFTAHNLQDFPRLFESIVPGKNLPLSLVLVLTKNYL